MFTPEIWAVPIFSGVHGGMLAYPSVEVLVLWVLIGAFVGCALALLWESFGAPRRSGKRTRDRRHVSLAPIRGCSEVVDPVLLEQDHAA